MNIKLSVHLWMRLVVYGLSWGTLLPIPALAQSLIWIQQLGTSASDESKGVATDTLGNVYISGYTFRGLPGEGYMGSINAWIAKYDTNSKLVWQRQIRIFDKHKSNVATNNAKSNGVATDSYGNVYIGGTTGNVLAGDIDASDAWVAKYDTSGKPVWQRQLGSDYDDDANGVATDTSGNVYISGGTEGALAGTSQGYGDAWVAKYDTSGKLLWKRQLGTSKDDTSYAVATDTLGNVYISGETDGALAGTSQGAYDAWVAKYNTSGKLLWKRQLGSSSSDASYAVATDTLGNVYISGGTEGALAGTSQGYGDAWIAKYDTSGKLLWKRQLGSSTTDTSSGVATDTSGNVYISGGTLGALAGASQGAYDAWVAKYNTSGKLVWKRQLGSYYGEASNSVTTDTKSNVYISGYTYSPLAGANQGGSDAWVAKYTQKPGE